jgi:hypothetical protein
VPVSLFIPYAHLLRHIRMQQKALWVEVKRDTGRWKSRWTVQNLLADRCGRAALDFLSSTDMGRIVPPLEESDAGSAAFEWELRERWEREEERRAEAGVLGAEDEPGVEKPPFLPTLSFMASAGEEQRAGRLFLVFFPFVTFSRDSPGWRAKGGLQRAASCGLRTGTGLKCTPP